MYAYPAASNLASIYWYPPHFPPPKGVKGSLHATGEWAKARLVVNELSEQQITKWGCRATSDKKNTENNEHSRGTASVIKPTTRGSTYRRARKLITK